MQEPPVLPQHLLIQQVKPGSVVVLSVPFRMNQQEQDHWRKNYEQAVKGTCLEGVKFIVAHGGSLSLMEPEDGEDTKTAGH